MPRHRGTYKPEHPEPYEVSRSQIQSFLKCPACFWMNRVKGIKFPGMPGFLLNTATDTLLKKDFDVIFEFGYQSVAISFALLPIKKSVIVTNMDGLEWKRAKWSPFVKKLTKWFEKLASEKSTFLISDNKGIQDYIKQKYNIYQTINIFYIISIQKRKILNKEN
mgnify:CR=1 FL=1